MHLEDIFATLTPAEIVSGRQFTEGPVWHPEGYLFFSDIPAGIIYRWQPSGDLKSWRDPSGHSNGLTLDHQGRLLACEHGNRRVSRSGADGAPLPVATHYQGKRLNSPNDLVVHSSGAIYFTDPPYGITEEQRELPHNGVYRLSEDGELDLLVDDMERPNGLAFSPDEQVMYIADTTRHQLRAYTVEASGILSEQRLFCQMDQDRPGPVGETGRPDGLKVDQNGLVFIAGAGGVWVYAPDGEFLGMAAVPQHPANLAFGGDDLCTLYITARTSLYTLRTHVPGVRVL